MSAPSSSRADAAGSGPPPGAGVESSFRRILIIGCGGAGKTTLARELGARLRLPVYHLDRLWWTPGWKPRAETEFDAELGVLLRRERWLLDGNFQRTLPERLRFADTVILLQFSRWRCLWGVFRRFLQFRGRTRPDLAPGCPERVSLHFLKFIWTFRRRMLPRLEQQLRAAPPGCRVLIFRSPREVRAFLRREIPPRRES